MRLSEKSRLANALQRAVGRCETVCRAFLNTFREQSAEQGPQSKATVQGVAEQKPLSRSDRETAVKRSGCFSALNEVKVRKALTNTRWYSDNSPS